MKCKNDALIRRNSLFFIYFLSKTTESIKIFIFFQVYDFCEKLSLAISNKKCSPLHNPLVISSAINAGINQPVPSSSGCKNWNYLSLFSQILKRLSSRHKNVLLIEFSLQMSQNKNLWNPLPLMNHKKSVMLQEIFFKFLDIQKSLNSFELFAD